MRDNNVDAPEFYDNAPESPAVTDDAKALSERMDIVQADLEEMTAEDIIDSYPDARITRSGALILVNEQPPLIDLRVTETSATLSGFYNSETEDRVIDFDSVDFELIKEELIENELDNS